MVDDIDGSDEEDVEQPSLFTDLDIGRIRYVKHGRGSEKLLLIHGFGGDLDNWVLNVDAFDDIATVYALDLPGHGQSVKTMPARTVDGLVRVVVAFMDKLGIESAHVAGHSLGGLISILLAQQEPGRVRSLVLINSAGLGPELNNSYLRSFIAANDLAELKPVLELLFANPEHLSPPMMQEYLSYKNREGVNDALQMLHDDMVADGKQRRVFADAVASLGIPVLAVAGKKDQIIPPKQTFALRRSIKVTIVPNAGHMLPMEKYKTLNELIREHIAA